MKPSSSDQRLRRFLDSLEVLNDLDGATEAIESWQSGGVETDATWTPAEG